jgi:hypothetical protein
MNNSYICEIIENVTLGSIPVDVHSLPIITYLPSPFSSSPRLHTNWFVQTFFLPRASVKIKKFHLKTCQKGKEKFISRWRKLNLFTLKFAQQKKIQINCDVMWFLFLMGSSHKNFELFCDTSHRLAFREKKREVKRRKTVTWVRYGDDYTSLDKRSSLTCSGNCTLQRHIALARQFQFTSNKYSFVIMRNKWRT